MSARVADLLADLLAPTLQTQATPANAANPAKSTQACGESAHSDPCEGLRIPANPQPAMPSAPADSQTFAAVRNPENNPPAQQPQGVSQDSQDSQGGCAAAAGPLTLIARQLPNDARQVLDVLLWIYPDTGAVNVRALADAARLPVGLVLGALDLLHAAGLVARHHGGAWSPSARLRHELQATDRAEP